MTQRQTPMRTIHALNSDAELELVAGKAADADSERKQRRHLMNGLAETSQAPSMPLMCDS